MKGSRYMTTSVDEMIVRLNAVAGVKKSTAKILTTEIDYLSLQTAQEVREMKNH